MNHKNIWIKPGKSVNVWEYNLNDRVKDCTGQLWEVKVYVSQDHVASRWFVPVINTENNLTILSIQIIEGNGADDVFLETNLPNGVWPYIGNATVKLQVAKGNGVSYCTEHFPNVKQTVIKG